MSNEFIISRDEKEAISLSHKLTNKIDLPLFWNEHKHQFLLNSFALPHALKESLRRKNTEMFDFFWSKCCENKIDLYNDMSFISDAVAIVTIINSTSLLDHLCEKITLPKLVLNTATFTILLQGRFYLTKIVDVDLFWHLLKKAYDTNFSLAIPGILTAASYNDPIAINLCIDYQNSNPNPKLLSAWENATKIALSKQNHTAALNIITSLAPKLPNFDFQDILLCAVKFNANTVVTQCMNNLKKVNNRLYQNMFKEAYLNNNVTIIKTFGKKIKDANLIRDAFIRAINTSANDMLDTLEDVTSHSRDEFIGLDDTYTPINVSDIKNNELSKIYATIDKEVSIAKKHRYTSVHHIKGKHSFEILLK